MPEPHTTIEWTPADSYAALSEGWEIFWTDSADHAPFELCAVAAPTDHHFPGSPVTYEHVIFGTDDQADDDAAWTHVRTWAALGSPIHRKALDFLHVHAPDEYARVATPRVTRRIKFTACYVEDGAEVVTYEDVPLRTDLGTMTNDERYEYLNERLWPLTGTGRTEGDAGYFAESADDVEPAIEMEWC